MPLSLPGNPAQVLLQGYDVTDFHKMRNADTAARDQHSWMGLQAQESQQKIDEQKYLVNARNKNDQFWAEAYAKSADKAGTPGTAPDTSSASNDRVTTLPGDNSSLPLSSAATSPTTPLAQSDASPSTGIGSAPIVGSGASSSAPAPQDNSFQDFPDSQSELTTPGQTPLGQLSQAAGSSAPSGPGRNPYPAGSGRYPMDEKGPLAPQSGLPAMSDSQRRDAQTQYVADKMNQAGYHSYGMAANAALMKGYKDAAELHDRELETVQRKVELTGDIMQSVTKVDPTADPATQTTDMQMWKQTATAAVGKLAQNGLITPQQAQTMLQSVAAGWDPQKAQQIEAQAQSAKNHGANLNAAREQNRVVQVMVKDGLDIQKAKGEVLKLNMEDMGRNVKGVPATDDGVANFVRGQAPGVQAKLQDVVDNPDLSPQEKLDIFAERGLSEQQRVARDARADNLDARRDQNTATAANEDANRKSREHEGALNRDARIKAAAISAANRANINTPLPALGGDAGASLTGEEFLKTLTPGDAAAVRAISEGREQPITGIGRTRGTGAALMNAVEQYDPGWSAQRAQVRKAFTTGPEGRNIGNLNTAVVHLDRWHEAAKAMANGDWQTGNKWYNAFQTEFGKDKATNQDFVMNALAGESASALKGNATDPEIAAVLKTLQGRKFSPAQAQGVTEEALKVYADKANTFNERYHSANPTDPSWSPILPSARAVFNRYGTTRIDPAANPRTQYVPGHVYAGMTYLGGDPNKAESWKK